MPEIQQTSAGFLIGPETMVILVVAITFILPAAKFAASELYAVWKAKVWKGKDDRQAEPGTAQALERLSNEMRAGFEKIRDLVAGHNEDLRELRIRLEHVEKRLDKLDSK